MPSTKRNDFNKAIDNLIEALNNLREYGAVTGVPDVPQEALDKQEKHLCLYCSEPLDWDKDKKRYLDRRGCHHRCHRKLVRMVESGEITNEQGISRGYWLPAKSGGRHN